MRTTVIVFTKAPRPGQVKTRLIPALGAAGAAALHRHLAWETLKTACCLPQARVQLWCAPDTTDQFFAACAHAFPVTLHAQQGADLGARMHHAFAHALLDSEAVLLVGTDCPRLDVAVLHAARTALAASCPAVVVPAEDGGYVLIGLTRLAAPLFSDVDWGTAQVLAQTRIRFQQLGWRWRELAALRDLDRPEDLAAFPELWPAHPTQLNEEPLDEQNTRLD